MIMIDQNSSHDSGVVFARDFYKSNKSSGNYFKSSSITSGIQNIKKELEGFSWYLERSRYPYRVEVLYQTERYIQVRYPRIIGKILNLNQKLGYAAIVHSEKSATYH